jgi:hypothetical protein
MVKRDWWAIKNKNKKKKKKKKTMVDVQAKVVKDLSFKKCLVIRQLKL